MKSPGKSDPGERPILFREYSSGHNVLSIQGNEIVVCVYIYGNVLQHLVKPLPSFTHKKSTICNNIIQHPDLVFSI